MRQPNRDNRMNKIAGNTGRAACVSLPVQEQCIGGLTPNVTRVLLSAGTLASGLLTVTWKTGCQRTAADMNGDQIVRHQALTAPLARLISDRAELTCTGDT